MAVIEPKKKWKFREARSLSHSQMSLKKKKLLAVKGES